eukprot:scaffold96769_cov63-Cyclotella_meneghiniana.AAC.6
MQHALICSEKIVSALVNVERIEEYNAPKLMNTLGGYYRDELFLRASEHGYIHASPSLANSSHLEHENLF